MDGTARRIVKVTVESKREQEMLGSDHYWEIFLFVPTPLLQIHNEFQETYPVVFCCTKLPQGMPVGEEVNERLKVAGFLFKRYRYITRRLNYSGKASRGGKASGVAAACRSNSLCGWQAKQSLHTSSWNDLVAGAHGSRSCWLDRERVLSK